MSEQSPEGIRPLLDVHRTAVVLDVSRGTIYRLIHDGDLKTVIVGHRIRIRPEHIEEYLNREEAA